MTSFLGHYQLHACLRLSNLPCSTKPKAVGYLVVKAAVPPRDRVIDFGKYKGRMLGTLPSTYLKWVSSNLRARDFEEWATLADQVLEDPIYNDRIEWEFAEKLLNGNASATNSNSQGAVSELLQLSQRFGWDNEDKVGWNRIDFQMLGTSKGGRIPRVKNKERLSGNLAEDCEKQEGRGTKGGGISETRVDRRERLKMKRSMPNMNKNNRFYNVGEYEGRKSAAGSSENRNAEVYNPFPGRETLLKNVLNQRRTG